MHVPKGRDADPACMRPPAIKCSGAKRKWVGEHHIRTLHRRWADVNRCTETSCRIALDHRTNDTQGCVLFRPKKIANRNFFIGKAVDKKNFRPTSFPNFFSFGTAKQLCTTNSGLRSN